MEIPVDLVSVLVLDEDVEQFPFRFTALLCDKFKNYYKTPAKHHLNKTWTINSPDFKLVKPYIQRVQVFQNLFVVMFNKEKVWVM